MPYLKRDRRAQLIAGYPVTMPGDLNFKVLLEVQGFLGDSPNYERFNAAIGALECCKLEIYRRMVAPYEDKKRDENGEVF